MLIYGVTNSGKSEFFKCLAPIFPCEQYIQQHRSPFDIDYSKSATFDHMKHYPSFILINEGAYEALLEEGDIADAKIFFEG